MLTSYRWRIMGPSRIALSRWMFTCLLVPRWCGWVSEATQETEYQDQRGSSRSLERLGHLRDQPCRYARRFPAGHAVYTINYANVAARFIPPRLSDSFVITAGSPVLPDDGQELRIQRRSQVEVGGKEGGAGRSEFEFTARSYESEETIWECT